MTHACQSDTCRRRRAAEATTVIGNSDRGFLGRRGNNKSYLRCLGMLDDVGKCLGDDQCNVA